MSLSYQSMSSVCVRDPITDVGTPREYAIIKSGSQSTFKQWSSTSVSNTSINFSCPPSSGGVFVDRQLYFSSGFRLSYTGICPNGQKLLNPNLDAPRSLPLASIIETIQLSINNTTVTLNCADVIHALAHFGSDEKVKNGAYSTTPNMKDASQDYNDLYGSIRSPLQGYGDSIEGAVETRGGYNFYEIVTNPVGNGVNPVTATIDCYFCEPLYISPLHWGNKEASGFFNVNTMDITLNFISNAANRLWSHAGLLGGVANHITSSSFVIGGQTNGPTLTRFPGCNMPPLIHAKYITPQESQLLGPNMALTYPYYDVQRYVTSQGTVTDNVAHQYNSNNIQLSSIPNRILIYMRRANSELYSNPEYTDTYFQINAINIQFLNKSGLLASASMQQLYQMSRRNGCNMSFEEWSGAPTYKAGDWTVPKFGTIGTIISINPALDFGLDSLQSNGKLEQCMFQVNVTATKLHQQNVQADLYIVVISEGSFTIQNLGSAMTQTGVITSKDILHAQELPYLNYNDITDPYGAQGGSFFDTLYNYGKKFNDYLKKSKIISRTLGGPLGTMGDIALSTMTGVPIPASKPLSGIASYLGYGEGGAVIGGKSMSKAQLRRRLC